MAVTVRELAELVQGELIGDGDLPTARATSEREMGSRHVRSMKRSASATKLGRALVNGATLAARVTSASTNASRLF